MLDYLKFAKKWNKDAGLTVSRNDFGKGFTLLAFSLNPSDFGEEFLDLVRNGYARLEMRFSQATTDVINCLCFYQSQAILTCNEARDIKLIEP